MEEAHQRLVFLPGLRYGEVATGCCAERAAFQVKPGDTVLLGKWGGTDISFDGEDYLIITEDDVLAVID